MKYKLLPTHNIANKGFSGIRRFVDRFNFSCTLIGHSPAIPYRPYCQTLAASIKTKLNDNRTISKNRDGIIFNCS